MMQRIARHPRLEKLRNWRRNRQRPWEGRGDLEARRQKGLCTNRGCADPATATVPGYPDPLPKCFTHEREYADRYGCEGIRPL